MKLLPSVLIALAIVASALIALTLHRRSQNHLKAGEAALREHEAQLALLTADTQRLSNRLSEAGGAPPEAAAQELEQLRQERSRLKKELRSTPQATAAAVVKKRAPRPEPRSPEYYQELHQRAGSKTREAMALGYALRMYAQEHENQAPKSVEDLVPYLRQQRETLSGTNQFEIIYHGSLDALAKVPSSAVALLRDRQTWTAPSGKQARVYGIADGSARIVESDDDFESWEAEHVVKPQK